MAGSLLYYISPILVIGAFVCFLRICVKIFLQPKDREDSQERYQYVILERSSAADGRPIRTLVSSDGIILQHLSAPKTHDVFNPNLPPSYEQAVTGRDRSIKVEDSNPGSTNSQTTAMDFPPPYSSSGGSPPLAPTEEGDDDETNDQTLLLA